MTLRIEARRRTTIQNLPNGAEEKNLTWKLNFVEGKNGFGRETANRHFILNVKLFGDVLEKWRGWEGKRHRWTLLEVDWQSKVILYKTSWSPVDLAEEVRPWTNRDRWVNYWMKDIDHDRIHCYHWFDVNFRKILDTTRQKEKKRFNKRVSPSLTSWGTIIAATATVSTVVTHLQFNSTSTKRNSQLNENDSLLLSHCFPVSHFFLMDIHGGSSSLIYSWWVLESSWKFSENGGEIRLRTGRRHMICVHSSLSPLIGPRFYSTSTFEK